ncbi:crossover junction endodeoxyribonuclease RuvC [Abditibacteriota bacterium]|nr:crossover junction endodeoxyribonuclease RuvC [Abditibacteriota bacterium]
MLRTRSINLPNTLRRPEAVARVRGQQRGGQIPTTRILGIDPGLARTGYGLIESDLAEGGRCIKLVEGGILRGKETLPLPDRLKALHAGLAEILAEYRPEIVVIEDLFSTYAHPRSALMLAHARGALILAVGQANLPLHTFTPNEVKQIVAGNGHATKSSIQSAVKARLSISAPLHPPDLADALAIAICYALRADIGRRLS